MSLGKRVVLDGRLDARKLSEKTTVYTCKEGKWYYAEIVVDLGDDEDDTLYRTPMFSEQYTAFNDAKAWAEKNKQFIH